VDMISVLPSEPGTRTLGDEAAIVRAAQDDPTAFGVLYHRYLGHVYAYVHARTSTADDAADLTQQIFLQALDALPRYRERGTFAAWLFRIAHNMVSNFHTRRRGTVPWDLLPEALHPHAACDVEDITLRRETVTKLHALLSALDPQKREILALRFAAQLPVADIAAVIGKSKAATEKQLARTLHLLQEQYDDDTQ